LIDLPAHGVVADHVEVLDDGLRNRVFLGRVAGFVDGAISGTGLGAVAGLVHGAVADFLALLDDRLVADGAGDAGFGGALVGSDAGVGIAAGAAVSGQCR